MMARDSRIRPNEMPINEHFWEAVEVWKLRQARIEIACRQQPNEKTVVATVASFIKNSSVTFRDAETEEELTMVFEQQRYVFTVLRK
jgi:hypothetical protein